MQRQIFKKTCSLMTNVCILTVSLRDKSVPDCIDHIFNSFFLFLYVYCKRAGNASVQIIF